MAIKIDIELYTDNKFKSYYLELPNESLPLANDSTCSFTIYDTEQGVVQCKIEESTESKNSLASHPICYKIDPDLSIALHEYCKGLKPAPILLPPEIYDQALAHYKKHITGPTDKTNVQKAIQETLKLVTFYKELSCVEFQLYESLPLEKRQEILQTLKVFAEQSRCELLTCLNPYNSRIYCHYDANRTHMNMFTMFMKSTSEYLTKINSSLVKNKSDSSVTILNHKAVTKKLDLAARLLAQRGSTVLGSGTANNLSTVVPVLNTTAGATSQSEAIPRLAP